MATLSGYECSGCGKKEFNDNITENADWFHVSRLGEGVTRSIFASAAKALHVCPDCWAKVKSVLGFK